MHDEREKLRRKQAQEWADLERRDEIKAAFARSHLAAVIESPRWSPGMLYAHKADAFVEAEAPDLPQALEIAERCQPLEVVRVSDRGTTYFAPWARVDGTDDAPKAEGAGSWIYTLDEWGKTLTSYAQAGDFILEIRVKVALDSQTVLRDVIRHTKYGPQREDHPPKNESGFFQGYVRFWSPQDRKSQIVFYNR